MEAPPPEDPALLSGIADRDPEAFRQLLERYGGPVMNLAFRFLGSRADAEEIAQEAFLRLYQRPPRLDPSARLFTWIYRVTVNLCLDALRRRGRAPQTVSLDLPADPEGQEGDPLRERLPHPSGATPREQLARSELAAATRRAVAALPQSLRAPLVLSTFEELPQEAIGQILGLSTKAVEHRLARARALLKSRLAPFL